MFGADTAIHAKHENVFSKQAQTLLHKQLTDVNEAFSMPAIPGESDSPGMAAPLLPVLPLAAFCGTWFSECPRDSDGL
jgi:hypothetical protein